MIYILLTIASACMLVAGCGGAHRDDRRLALADSLMWSDPDSALAIVRAVSPASLTTDGDRTFRALLLTQASYRCYVPLTSDSLISASVEYYRDNGNRERYTRALLYTGAAHEDMGNPVEAMRWYKLAEAAADTADYRNLAQLNMRMGVIYYDNYAHHNLSLNKLKNAARFYELLGDKRMTMVSDSYLGNIYRQTSQDSARLYLNATISLAKEIGDTIELYEALNSLSLSYLLDDKPAEAYATAQLALSIGKPYVEDHCYYNIARALCAMNNSDSAWLYIAKATPSATDLQLLTVRYLTLNDYYKAKGDIGNYKKYNALYQELSDSLNNNQTMMSLLDSGEKQDKEFHSGIISDLNKKSQIVIGLTLLCLVAVIIFVIVTVRRNNHYKDIAQSIHAAYSVDIENHKKLLDDLDRRTLTLTRNTQVLNEEIKRQDSYNSVLREMVTYHIDMMGKIMTANESGESARLKQLIKSMIDHYGSNERFWDATLNYVNIQYDNIIERIKTSFPSLNEKQIRIIALHFMGYDTASCALIMDTTKGSMGVICTRIAKKMNLQMPLSKYVKTVKDDAKKAK